MPLGHRAPTWYLGQKPKAKPPRKWVYEGKGFTAKLTAGCLAQESEVRRRASARASGGLNSRIPHTSGTEIAGMPMVCLLNTLSGNKSLGRLYLGKTGKHTLFGVLFCKSAPRFSNNSECRSTRD